MASLISTKANELVRRLLTAGILLAVFAGIPLYGWTQVDTDSRISKQQVEAAYLYKFGNYITWPQTAFTTADSPVVIGVSGADALADELTSLVAGRTIANRPVVVRRVYAKDQLNGVNILFIGDTKSAQAGNLFQSVRGQPVLVVTEGDNGLDLGGAVSFVVIDDRVRFDVSLQAAEKNGLKLSALLLSVAHTVSGAQQ